MKSRLNINNKELGIKKKLIEIYKLLVNLLR